MRVLDVKGNTEAENEAPTKWKGYITASIAVPLERAWQIGSDFSGLHKFVPIVEVCERLKGCNRTPGCLRFYTMSSATGLPGGKRKAWAKDRLLSIDEETHSYTYAVEGSNMHLENCQISFTASDGQDGTTIVRWAWEVDPVTKSTKEKTLGDMSEFGCTFIKGLEAATAAAAAVASSANDSMDFNFEGAPLDTLCGDDDDAAAHDDDGDGAGHSSHPPPVLSLMKSRLETLTHSLNKISQKLEAGPIPHDLYHNELESLQSILAEGRQSLQSHLNGSASDDTRLDNSPSFETISKTAERYEHNTLLSTTAKTASPTAAADLSSCRTASKECRRNCLDAKSRLGKGGTRGALKGGQQCSSAMFPPLSSTDEGLRVEMDKAAQVAYEAFHDFSNQFHSDLRDDISHQLESVEARLDCMSAGMKDGTPNVRPNGDGENCGFCSGPIVVGHESRPQTSMQESSSDARWYHSANVAKMTPDDYNHQGQPGHWEPEGLQGRRLQGSPKGMHSLRVRSGQLFRDLLEEEMSQDSDQAIHQEPKVSPRTFEFTNSFRDLKVTLGCASCCQTRGSSNTLNVTNVPKGDHLLEKGTFTLSSPLQDNSYCPAGDHQHAYELETGEPEQGLKMDHGTSELRRRTLGPEGHMASALGLMLDDSSSQEFQSSEESGGEGFQQLQDSPQGWKHRGSKMRRTALNLEADLSRLQIPGSKLQEVGRPEQAGDGQFHSPIPMPRPSRLPPDIWPHFSHEESGLEGHLVKERVRQDNSRRKLDAHDLQMFELSGEEFRLRPATQRPRAVQQRESESTSSSSSSSSSSRSSRNYKRLLKCQCLPPRFPPSGEPLPQTVAGGLRNPLTSPISSLESPVSGSPSGPRDPHSDCPLSALHAFGQCAEHVMLDLRNEISPGVFHSRQGQQTRVIIDIPEDLESRQASRRQLNSLIRKAEIYKEFALLGIQKPPTEEQLLADLKSARYKKQQQAISATETSSSRKVPPAAYQPYYADGRVFPPDAGPSPRNVDKSRLDHADAHNVQPPTSRLPTKAKCPGDQNVGPGQSSEPQVLSGKSVSSRSRPPNGRIMAKGPQSEQQLNATTNRFQKNESHTTSEGLRGETTARELAAADSKCTKPPRGGFHGAHPGSKPRLQSDEGSSCRHGFSMQKRDIPSKGYGKRAPPARQPFNSKGEAKPDSRAFGSTESPQVQPSSSYEGKSKPCKNAVSNSTESSSQMAKTGHGDRAYGEHKSLGSGDPFIHQTLDEIESDFSTFPALHPKIRIFSQGDNLLKFNPTTPALALHTGNSPRSSSEGSIAKILINFPRGSRESRQLELTRYRPPTSRQGSLDELVNNLPSESGSSVFDPYRPGGKFGSVDGSSGSDSINRLPFSRQLHIADLHRNTTPTTPDEPPSLTDGQSNSLTQLHFHETLDHHHHPNIIASSMYVDHHNRPEAQLGGPNAMMPPSGRRCHECPFRQLKNDVDELILASEPASPRSLSQELNIQLSWAGKHPHHSPSCSRTDGEEPLGPSSPRGPPPFVANPGGMPTQLMQQSDFWKPPHHLPRPHIVDEVSRQLDAKHPKSFRDAQTQTDGDPGGEGPKPPQSTKPEGQDGLKFLQSTQTGTKPEVEEGLQPPQSIDKGKGTKPEGEEGLRTRQYTQILDEMASSAAKLTDDPQAHTKKVDDLVQQTGDAGLMSSWNAKKKRRADKLAVRTRSTITMLNSAINVREFTESSRSYSTWLDGAAQQQQQQQQQTPEGHGQKSLNSETQTSKGTSEEPESGEEPRGEPRFREDSAANFLGSVAGQILHEFSESHKTPSDEQIPLEGGSQEPRFREDSAANFLGSMSQKIVQEFTDYTPNQSEALVDQSEGHRQRRFREQSALKFLEALSDQLLPEFKNRRSSRTGETSEGGRRGPRFRETSAINFLDALRGLVMENSRPDSSTISDIPSWSDQNAPSEVLQSMSPTEGSGDAKALQEEPFLTEGWNYQPQSDGQVSPGEGLSYQPGSEGQGSPGEGLSSQAESEDQRSPGEGTSQQPESVSQGSQGEGFTYQPESQGQGSPVLSDQSEGQGSLVGAFSDHSEGQGSPVGALSDQSEGQGSPVGGLSDQSEGQGSPYGNLSNQPGSEGQQSADLGLSYQPESEGKKSPEEGLSDHQPESSVGEKSPEGAWSDQPESEGQKSPDGGLSYQPESEGQASTDGGLSYQPETELQGYPDGEMSDQPESEGQGSPKEEDVSDQPGAEDQAYPDESVGNQTDGSTSTTTDQASQNELYGAGRRSSQAQLGAVGPGGSRRSSQVAVLNEMLQDLHATVSRSRQNSVSSPNPGSS